MKQPTSQDNAAPPAQEAKKRGRPRKNEGNDGEKEEKHFGNFEQQPVGEPLKRGEAHYQYYLCDALNYSNKHKDQKVVHTVKVGNEVLLGSTSKESKYVSWLVLAIFRRYNATLWNILVIRTSATKDAANLREFPAGYVASTKPSETNFSAQDIEQLKEHFFEMKRTAAAQVKSEATSPLKKVKTEAPGNAARAPQARAVDLGHYLPRFELNIEQMSTTVADAKDALREIRGVLADITRMRNMLEEREEELWRRAMDVPRVPPSM